MRKNTATHRPRPEFLTSIAAPPVGASQRSLRILLLVSAHNGLSQCSWLALTELGHEVEVAVVDSGAAMEAAVRDHDPELIVCPFLKTMIPETVWRRHRCLIIHPGPPGDRGPSSLDWAIELGATDWGVTVLEANGEFDAGESGGHEGLPDATGREGEPVPPRGAARRDRRTPRSGCAHHQRPPPRRSPAPIPAGDRLRPAPHAPVRQGDQLADRPR